MQSVRLSGVLCGAGGKRRLPGIAFSHNGLREIQPGVAALNIIDIKWYQGRHKGMVGVVLTKTDYAGYRAFIGVGMGVNQDYDSEFIVDWGDKLPRPIAEAYFPKKIKKGVMYDGKANTRPEGS